MSNVNEIGDQDLSHEPATPAAGTSHVGKAIIIPHAPVHPVAASDPPAEVAGTDADHAGTLDGTTDAGRPGSTPVRRQPLPPPDRTAAGPAVGDV